MNNYSETRRIISWVDILVHNLWGSSEGLRVQATLTGAGGGQFFSGSLGYWNTPLLIINAYKKAKIMIIPRNWMFFSVVYFPPERSLHSQILNLHVSLFP